jgi:hypothetical protein
LNARRNPSPSTLAFVHILETQSMSRNCGLDPMGAR